MGMSDEEKNRNKEGVTQAFMTIRIECLLILFTLVSTYAEDGIKKWKVKYLLSRYHFSNVKIISSSDGISLMSTLRL